MKSPTPLHTRMLPENPVPARKSVEMAFETYEKRARIRKEIDAAFETFSQGIASIRSDLHRGGLRTK